MKMNFKMNFEMLMKNMVTNEDAQINWYLKWKDRIISSLKTNTDNFLKYTNQQIKENGSFLEQNREVILNNKKYPANFKNPIKNAPNYQEAVRRLSRPISHSLYGLNLNKIEIQDNQVFVNDINNITVESNVWFRKLIIPIYDGKNSFINTAKAYFYGSEKRYTLTIQEIQRVLSIGFKFCYNYDRTIRFNDLMNLVAFINSNSVSGLQQNPTTISDLQAIKNNQLNNKPKIDNINTNQISFKRKQIACDILQDAYNAKITTMGLIYRDFINIMKNHVSNYK